MREKREGEREWLAVLALFADDCQNLLPQAASEIAVVVVVVTAAVVAAAAAAATAAAAAAAVASVSAAIVVAVDIHLRLGLAHPRPMLWTGREVYESDLANGSLLDRRTRQRLGLTVRVLSLVRTSRAPAGQRGAAT